MKRLAFVVIRIAGAACAACGGSSADGGDADKQPAPPDEPAAVADCAPGTRPVAGAATCEPVGTTSVPAGFEAEPTGWGFRAVLPSAPCTGATIAVLGRSACEPIDACDGAFPPADATIAVRATATPFADRPDLKVVQTITDALAASAPGAVIAVDEGEFALPAAFAKAARLVGRCAAKTALRGDGFGVKVAAPIAVGLQSLALVGAPKLAVMADRSAKVTLDRVWVHGDYDGADVGNGATLTVVRSVFEGPKSTPNPGAATSAVFASYGGHATITGSEIRGWQTALAAESVGTTVDVSASVLHEQVALDAEPASLATVGAFLGAAITIDGSDVESTPGRIAMIGAQRLDGVPDPTSPGDPPASVRVTRGTLVQGGARREAGSAVDTVSGATLDLDDVSVRHDCYVALSASEGATVTAKSSVIQTAPSAENARAAFGGLSKGKLVVDASAIVGTAQIAMLLDQRSSAAITRSLFTGNHEVGIADITKFMGAAQAVAIARGGQATVKDSALVGNEGSAIFVDRGTAEIERTVLAATRASRAGSFSAAVTAVDATLTVRASTFAKNDRALALRRGRALLRDSAVTDHREALRLEDLVLVETADAIDDAVDAELVAARTTFLRNGVLMTPKALTDE